MKNFAKDEGFSIRNLEQIIQVYGSTLNYEL